MMTFLIILALIVIIGSFLSGITDRNKRVKDYQILHNFNSKVVTGNKESQRLEIIRKGSDKNYVYENSLEIVRLCKRYFNNYEWELPILEIIISALCVDRYFDEAEKYANVLINEQIDIKWGYFFNGEIAWYKNQIHEGIKMFRLSESPGMDKNFIKSRKKELIPYLKPSSNLECRAIGREKKIISETHEEAESRKTYDKFVQRSINKLMNDLE